MRPGGHSVIDGRRSAPERGALVELILTAAVCLLVGGVLGYLAAYWRYALKPYFEERSWR